MGSPLRSPFREAQPAPAGACTSAASAALGVDPLPRPSPRGTAALSNLAPGLPTAQGSPLRPPAQEDVRQVRPGPVPSLPSPPLDPLVRAPLREDDRPTGRVTPPSLSYYLQGSPAGSPAHEAGRPAGLSPAPPFSVPPRKDSPPRDGGRAITALSYADAVEKLPSPMNPIVNRAAARDDPPAVTKVEKGVGGAVGLDAPNVERGSRGVSSIIQRRRRGETLGRAAIGVRLAAVVLSLVSFSVMAADKTKGWTGDSFDRYREYRFCITVNILTFIYSGFQTYAQAHRLVYQKDIIRPPGRYYFDFAMDQVLAYLLIAASSSAATLNNDWVSNWGTDPFTVMANGSISVSFLAFVALAISALISAHILFSWNS